jgi:hypothetical protein
MIHHGDDAAKRLKAQRKTHEQPRHPHPAHRDEKQCEPRCGDRDDRPEVEHHADGGELVQRTPSVLPAER